MENPDAYRAGKELAEFEWRQNHRNYYSCFSLKFYQENDMPLLTGWFPSQSGDDEVRESRTDAFSNPIPWQLTWVQWFELQNMLAETDLPEYRKPSSDAVDETDSEIRVVWRTDDGDETQTLSGSHAEALEALVLGIAEEAYAASKLETEQRAVRETAELIGIYWNQSAPSARDCFSFLLTERTMPSRSEKQMLFSYRYQDGGGKTVSRKGTAVEPEKAQAYFSSIGQELRVLELPVYPGVCPDGVADSYIAATWQDGGEVFTNDYCGDSAQSIFNLLAAFAEETEALIFSRPAPEDGWKCPSCGMPNGRSVFCMKCGAMRSAK
ncbi:unknown [Firmicutes bacterium CAG:170]|nr:unknown [Firmicutes bacterium CAG:170]